MTGAPDPHKIRVRAWRKAAAVTAAVAVLLVVLYATQATDVRAGADGQVADPASNDQQRARAESELSLWEVLADAVASRFWKPDTPDPSAAAGVDVQVIGAGFGRTGTDSLRRALDMLGYKTYHMTENVKSGHMDLWNELALRPDVPGARPGTRSAADADKVLDVLAADGYTATTDFPSCLVFDHQLRRNPKARVILSLRSSPEAWVASYQSTIGNAAYICRHPPFSFLFGCYPFHQWLETVSGLHPDDEELGIASTSTAVSAYSEWADYVRSVVPNEQLLEYVPGDGWEPLCAHLGIDDCPSAHGLEYPRGNAKAPIKAAAGFLRFVIFVWPAVVCLVPLLFVLCCVRRCRRRVEAEDDKKRTD